jgi:hypothetical protein
LAYFKKKKFNEKEEKKEIKKAYHKYLIDLGSKFEIMINQKKDPEKDRFKFIQNSNKILSLNEIFDDLKNMKIRKQISEKTNFSFKWKKFNIKKVDEFFTITSENEQQGKTGFITEQNSDSKSKKIVRKVIKQ